MKYYYMSVAVPAGRYCARKVDGSLFDQCPMLHSCQSCEGAYYCAVVNCDTHLGEDEQGILKHHGEPVWYACPSTYEDSLQEMYRKERELNNDDSK